MCSTLYVFNKMQFWQQPLIKQYNAQLLTYSVSGTTLTNNISSNVDILKMPSLFSTVLSTRQLAITITFFPVKLGSDSKNTTIQQRLMTATDNITRFEAEIIGKITEIELPDGYIYTALISSIAAAAFDGSGEHDVVYTFSAVRHKAPEKIIISANETVECKFTSKTPCKFVLYSARILRALQFAMLLLKILLPIQNWL